MMIRTFAKTVAAALLVVSVSACASQDETDKLRSDVAALRADVAKAQATADRAAADARAALDAANAAKEAANRMYQKNLRK
jgi:outer membrane murein-binding lipoprotein Lpp